MILIGKFPSLSLKKSYPICQILSDSLPQNGGKFLPVEMTSTISVPDFVLGHALALLAAAEVVLLQSPNHHLDLLVALAPHLLLELPLLL